MPETIKNNSIVFRTSAPLYMGVRVRRHCIVDLGPHTAIAVVGLWGTSALGGFTGKRDINAAFCMPGRTCLGGSQ